MTYIYTYKDTDYRSYYEVIHLPDFKNVSFPRKEAECKESALNALGITRREYVPPEPSLIVVKERKKQELTSRRDQVEDENVTTNKGEFEFDALSRTRLSNAMNALSEGNTREWTTANGRVVEMSKDDFQVIFTTAASRSDTAYAKLNRLKEKVEACTTVEEVEAINWEDEEDEDEEE